VKKEKKRKDRKISEKNIKEVHGKRKEKKEE